VQIVRYPLALGFRYPPQGLLRPLALGYVADDVDRHPDRSLLPEDRCGLDYSPALLARGQDAKAQYLLGPFFAI